MTDISKKTFLKKYYYTKYMEESKKVDEHELNTDPQEYFQQFQDNMKNQINELEAELNELQANTVLKDKKNSTARITTLYPQFDSTLEILRQGQEEEAIYSIVRIVQRLLDEKAAKKALTDKANVEYVDNLCERLSSGIQENLKQYHQESLSSLESNIFKLKKKIDEIRIYMQHELRDIQIQIDDLHNFDDTHKNEISPLSAKQSQLMATTTQRQDH